MSAEPQLRRLGDTPSAAAEESICAMIGAFDFEQKRLITIKRLRKSTRPIQF